MLQKQYHILAWLFALFGVMCACLGSGSFAQVNSIMDICNITLGVDSVTVGACVTIAVAVVTIGGLQSIANVTSAVVPTMAVLYFVCTVGILCMYASQIPAAISLVLQSAFTLGYASYGKMLLMIGLVLFAFTTILGWNYYGERCVVYLFGEKLIKPYRILFICIIACSPFLKLEEIWALADIVNGLMAFPNLVALLMLSGVVVSETKAYMEYLENKPKD